MGRPGRQSSARSPRSWPTAGPNDIHYVQGNDGQLLEVNDRACTALGYSREELLRLSAFDIVAGFNISEAVMLRRCLEHDGHATIERRLRRKDGTTFPAEFRVLRLEADGQSRYEVVIRNLTAPGKAGEKRARTPRVLHALGGTSHAWPAEARPFKGRRSMEQQLRESEERFRQLMTQAADGLCVANEQGRLVEVNRAACRMLGHTREELLRLSAFDVVADLNRSEVALLFQSLLHEPHITVERMLRRKDGAMVPVELRVNPIDIRRERHLLMAVRDIGDRKKAEAALRTAFAQLEHRSTQLAETVAMLNHQMEERDRVEQQLRSSRARLRALSTRLLSIQEEERRRISREIHDELGQLLTALRLDLGWLSQKLDDQPGPLRAKLESMAELVDTSVESVQSIASNLRPALLDDLGLVAAIEWQVKEFQGRTGLVCRLAIGSPNLRLDGELSTTVFRVVQEALTNIARHSGARRVEIKMRAVAHCLVLIVRDDGRGIRKAEAEGATALGLVGMRERVLHRGGVLRIKGMPGKGTLLRVELPLQGGPPGDQEPAEPGKPAR
jgi:two-component system, NarL family, sensor histidine kinase UhpB